LFKPPDGLPLEDEVSAAVLGKKEQIAGFRTGVS
jgi:hypothetical protein